MGRFYKKLIILSMVLALTAPVHAFVITAEDYYLSWENAVFEEITYDANGWPTIHYLVPATEFMPQEEEKVEWVRIPPLTEVSEVGTTLGNILKEEDNLNLKSYTSYQEVYASHSIGQCV